MYTYMYITYTQRIHYIHLQNLANLSIGCNHRREATTTFTQRSLPLLSHELISHNGNWILCPFSCLKSAVCSSSLVGRVGSEFNVNIQQIDTEVTFGLMKNEKACNFAMEQKNNPLGDSSQCSSLWWVKSILRIAGETKTSQTTDFWIILCPAKVKMTGTCKCLGRTSERLWTVSFAWRMT